jgi:hypothetical protein
MSRLHRHGGLWSQLPVGFRCEGGCAGDSRWLLAGSDSIVGKGGKNEVGVGMPSYSKGSEVAGLLDVGVGWGTSLTSRSPFIRPRGVPVYFGRQMYKPVEAQLLGKQAKYSELRRENDFPWHLRQSIHATLV